jgi:[protein-PII] uridylyltransferase
MLPKLSVAWGQLRGDLSLRGKDWSAAAGQVADRWLRQLFATAVAEAGVAASSSPGRLASFRARWRPGSSDAVGTRQGTGHGQPAGPVSGGGEAGPAAGGVTGLALLAVGSHGRGDLAPGSDLDLLLVHSGWPKVTAVADKLWYPIWDDPMPLDHSVRTLAQARDAAESDLRVALGLLDGRLVAGDPELGDELIRLGRRLWEARASKWLPEVLAAREASQQAHGEVAFLLEPELQEARGGLRDVQVLALLASVTPVLPEAASSPELAAAADLLHRVKVELQRPTAKRGEKLLLEDQDRVAGALGMQGREELAHEIANAGRTVAWVIEDAARRARSWLAGPRGRGGSADTPLGPGVVLRDDEIVVPLVTAVGDDPSLALRAAAASAELGVPISRATMARLAAEAPLPTTPWPDDVLRAFLRLLSTGQAAIHAIETLDQLGIWPRYMPEWSRARNRPQFDPYHRWTVDRHLLEAVANAASQARDVRRPDLLVLGALLHDIGKGSGEDHSRAGAVIAAEIAERLGLASEDAATLVKLVRFHLLLPDTATRRDVEDPATAAGVADAVEDATTLELLAALAVADGRATGPAAWSDWKAGLIERLVERTGALLEGRPLPEGTPFPSEEHRRLMQEGGVRVVPEERQLTVVAPDRPGLLADVTAVLAMYGIALLDARAHSEHGQALEVFTLDLPEAATPRWQRVAEDIEGAALKRFNVAEALARYEQEQSRHRRRRRAAALPSPEVKVTLDNAGASAASILEVRAPDVPGLLHKVAAAIADLGLDILSARVSTLGNAAVDTFYVRAGGTRLPDAEAGEARLALEKALRAPSEAEGARTSRNTPET